MSQEPYTSPSSQGSGPPQPAPSNTMGMFGFIISLVGLLLTCGVLSPLGLLLSLIGLLKAPRGMAIAGTVVGLIGTAVLATIGIGVVTAALAAVGIAKAVGPSLETITAIAKAQGKIEEYRQENGALPDAVEGNKLVLDIKDGWKNGLRYDYEQDSPTFVIRSAGADGKFDTPDDMKSTDQGSMTPPEIESGTLTPVMPEEVEGENPLGNPGLPSLSPPDSPESNP